MFKFWISFCLFLISMSMGSIAGTLKVISMQLGGM